MKKYNVLKEQIRLEKERLLNEFLLMLSLGLVWLASLVAVLLVKAFISLGFALSLVYMFIAAASYIRIQRISRKIDSLRKKYIRLIKKQAYMDELFN